LGSAPTTTNLAFDLALALQALPRRAAAIAASLALRNDAFKPSLLRGGKEGLGFAFKVIGELN
jgi:hypothetical protein